MNVSSLEQTMLINKTFGCVRFVYRQTASDEDVELLAKVFPFLQSEMLL
jgi:hypothetical protein